MCLDIAFYVFVVAVVIPITIQWILFGANGVVYPVFVDVDANTIPGWDFRLILRQAFVNCIQCYASAPNSLWATGIS